MCHEATHCLIYPVPTISLIHLRLHCLMHTFPFGGELHQDTPDEGLANKLNKEADIHLKAFAFTAENFHKTLHTYKTILES